MADLATAAPVAVFGFGVMFTFVMWICLYAIPASQSVYDFSVAYEPLLMTGVSMGLFTHALFAMDVYFVSMAGFVAGVLAWIQVGFTFSWLVGDPNHNAYRNITTNPNAGATVSQYNSNIALLVLSILFVTWIMAYWIYVFAFRVRNFCGVSYGLMHDKSDDAYLNAWGVNVSWQWVSDKYFGETRRNLGLNSFTFHLLCVVGFSGIVLGMFIISISYNVAQMYLGPIPNTLFANALGVFMMVRPLGPYPFNGKRKFYGKFFDWLIVLVVHGFGVGVSAANLWLRSEYVTNQANRIDSITDKSSCVLSVPCYETLATSTVFYEYGVSVAYVPATITDATSWANASYTSYTLEIAAFVFGCTIWFVRLYWFVAEILRVV